MQNHLERQKEWADNFFIKQKKLHWILNGYIRIWSKKFEISTIFTNRLELAIFKRVNQPERQKERADNFFYESKN